MENGYAGFWVGHNTFYYENILVINYETNAVKTY
jgi:hypothetical protein